MMGGGSVSAYTEECLPEMNRGSNVNTCPVTQTYASELLIAPPKIGHSHHLCCFACSSAVHGSEHPNGSVSYAVKTLRSLH